MENGNYTPLFSLDSFERKPRFTNGFFQRDILSVDQFSNEDLDYIFTARMKCKQ